MWLPVCPDGQGAEADTTCVSWSSLGAGQDVQLPVMLWVFQELGQTGDELAVAQVELRVREAV